MKLNILIVDDDKMITLLHKVIVVKYKICSNSPILFSDGKMTLEFLLSEYNPDENYLVLLDINMPIMDGWGFLNSVQGTAFANKLRIVMVTSSVDIADKNKAGQFPQVIAYMEKPLRIDACNKIKQFPELTTFYN